MWQKAKNQYHLGQAILANLIYMFPSRKLKIIGVTGTDGKTTTASLIYHILVSAGHKAALITSNGAVLNERISDVGYHVTTPGRFALQSYLRQAIKFEVEYVVLEITSHALDQHRSFGIPIEIGVLTNVSNEHLDYHKTYENYLKTKLKLLKQAKIAVVNKDDKSYKSIQSTTSITGTTGKKKIISYGLNKDSDVNPYNFPFKTKLLGKFNEYNCLAAIAVTNIIQIPEEEIRNALLNFKPPVGRQEIVYDKKFCVINDFAHTPNAFKSVLPEVRKITKGRLIHVFGAAAKRDAYKRPEMGKISSEYADTIILTAEDPRGESPDKISDEILSGISNFQFQINTNFKFEKGKKYVFKIPDRREAIEFAVSLAEEGDTVLLTGKGHEKSINYGRGEESWNESEVAMDAIKKKINNNNQ